MVCGELQTHPLPPHRVWAPRGWPTRPPGSPASRLASKRHLQEIRGRRNVDSGALISPSCLAAEPWVGSGSPAPAKGLTYTVVSAVAVPGSCNHNLLLPLWACCWPLGCFPVPCGFPLALNYPLECVTSFLKSTRFRSQIKGVRGGRRYWPVTVLSFYTLGNWGRRALPDLSQITASNRAEPQWETTTDTGMTENLYR